MRFETYYEVEASIAQELAHQFNWNRIPFEILRLDEERIALGTDTDDYTLIYLVKEARKQVADMKKIREKATVDVDALFEQCKKELRDIGIPIAADEQMHLEIRRIKNSDVQAYCSIMGGRYTIVVKACHTTGKHPDIQQLCCEIMHELVHTCKDCDNHGKLFMDYGRIIDEKLGYNILQLEDLLSYRHADQAIQIIGECPTCLSKIIYRTEKDIEKHLGIYGDSLDKGNEICPYCNSKYTYKRVTK